MGSYPQKCSYEEEKVRPGYVRPGLSVDEAYRRWNMSLIRKRKEKVKLKPETDREPNTFGKRTMRFKY